MAQYQILSNMKDRIEKMAHEVQTIQKGESMVLLILFEIDCCSLLISQTCYSLEHHYVDIEYAAGVQGMKRLQSQLTENELVKQVRTFKSVSLR